MESGELLNRHPANSGFTILGFVLERLDLKLNMSQFKQSVQKQNEILSFWVQLWHVYTTQHLTEVEPCENWHAGVIIDYSV